MDKIAPLTSLRFFAAAGVVYFHLQRYIGVTPDTRYALGVSLFFVLSGFILTFVYSDRKNFSLSVFFGARLGRLWPVHALTFIFALTVLSKYTPSLILVSNAAMVHDWVPIKGYPFSVNAVSWSISAELAFYIFFPLLAFRSLLALGAAAAAVLAILFYLNSTYTATELASASLSSFSPFHLIQQNPAVRILEFIVGVAAARLFLTKRLSLMVLTWPNLLEVTALGFVAVHLATVRSVTGWLYSHNAVVFGLWYDQSGGLVAFAALIFVFAHSAGKVSQALAARPLVILGEVSFCTYMVHNLCFRFAIKYGLVQLGGGHIVPSRDAVGRDLCDLVPAVAYS